MRTLRGLRRHGAGQRESAAVLLGHVSGGVWNATRVLYHRDLGDRHASAFAVVLGEKAKIRLYEELGRTGLRVVALIHTHPADWVDLSSIDEANQISSRVGVWSLVVPYYARPRGWSLDKIGVHVRTTDGWVRLTPDETRARVLLEG